MVMLNEKCHNKVPLSRMWVCLWQYFCDKHLLAKLAASVRKFVHISCDGDVIVVEVLVGIIIAAVLLLLIIIGVSIFIFYACCTCCKCKNGICCKSCQKDEKNRYVELGRETRSIYLYFTLSNQRCTCLTSTHYSKEMLNVVTETVGP